MKAENPYVLSWFTPGKLKRTAGLYLGSRPEDRDYSVSKGEWLRYALRSVGIHKNLGL